MRDITLGMKEYLATSDATLATLWIITTVAGSVFRSTDFSETIIYEGNSYLSVHGQQRTAIQFTSDLNEDNFESKGFVNIMAPKSDFVAGRFDYAEIKIFQINPYNHALGQIKLLKGNFGSIKIEDYEFRTEITSRLSQLKAAKVSLCSPTCRARLGDSQCGVNLTPFTTTGVITNIHKDTLRVDVTLAITTLDTRGGILTWTSGLNVGTKLDVKDSYSAGSIGLLIWPMYDPQDGDTFTLSQSCDKTFATCGTRYSNTVNFRGEPNIPGSDQYFQRIESK